MLTTYVQAVIRVLDPQANKKAAKNIQDVFDIAPVADGEVDMPEPFEFENGEQEDPDDDVEDADRDAADEKEMEEIEREILRDLADAHDLRKVCAFCHLVSFPINFPIGRPLRTAQGNLAWIEDPLQLASTRASSRCLPRQRLPGQDYPPLCTNEMELDNKSRCRRH